MSIPLFNPTMPAPITLSRRNINHNETIRTSVTTTDDPVTALTSMRDILVDRIRQNKLECTICYEIIGRTTRIWSCPICYVIFHFTCIQAWIRQCLKGTRIVNLNSSKNSWRCPCCQTIENSIPDMDHCFCGKVCRPRIQKYSLKLAHSCGESCGRQGRHRCDDSDFQYTCLHPCTMICHPGPCPDCMVTPVDIPCFCGAINLSMTCHQVVQLSDRSCGRPCRRRLDCGFHSCEKLCHAGSCDPCSYQTRIRCYCGRQERELTCRVLSSTIDNDGFSCGGLCLKTDACLEMLHPCQEICHHGPCRSPCAFDPSIVKTCHCGKKLLRELSEYPRLRCTSPIPTCDQICELVLSCSSNRLLDLVKHPQQQRHRCPKPCHNDPCTFSCTQKVTLTCRCGSSQEIIECHQLDAFIPTGPLHVDPLITGTIHQLPLITRLDVLLSVVSDEDDRSNQAPPFSIWKPETLRFYTTKTCHRRCDQQLSCQRHFCHEICCPFHHQHLNEPSHQQQQSYYYDITFQTSTTTVMTTEANSNSAISIIEPPRCVSPCLKELSCGKHVCEVNCHQGPCPPCGHYELDDVVCKCGTLLFRPPIACRDERSYKFAITSRGFHPCRRPRLCGHADHHYCHTEETCPPCMFPVHRICPCRRKWILRNIPCSQQNVSCGAPCQNPLPCGVHVCQRPCHEGSCLDWESRDPQPSLSSVTTTSNALTYSQPETESIILDNTLIHDSSLHHHPPSPNYRCRQPCGRRLSCGHTCIQSCHSIDPCPEGECRSKTMVSCPCSRLRREQVCHNNYGNLNQNDYDHKNRVVVADICESTSLSSIPCDEVCQSMMRHGLTDLDESSATPSSSALSADYTIRMCHFAKEHHRFTRQLERMLNDFIVNANQSVLVLPVMSRSRRGFTYELVTYYKLDAQGLGKDPHRCILLKKNSATRIPPCILSDYLERWNTTVPESTNLSPSLLVESELQAPISDLSLSEHVDHLDDHPSGKVAPLLIQQGNASSSIYNVESLSSMTIDDHQGWEQARSRRSHKNIRPLLPSTISPRQSDN